MPRKAKEPGAMLEMAAPEILAKMQAPSAEPRQRRMRRSRGFEKSQLELGRRTVVTPTTPIESEEPDRSNDPFAEARKPTRGGKSWSVGELSDYEQLTSLPVNGKCTCGGKPYTWTNAQGISQSKRNENIGYFCPHTAHGGNGRFWLFSELYTPKKRGRPRKVATEFKDVAAG